MALSCLIPSNSSFPKSWTLTIQMCPSSILDLFLGLRCSKDICWKHKLIPDLNCVHQSLFLINMKFGLKRLSSVVTIKSSSFKSWNSNIKKSIKIYSVNKKVGSRRERGGEIFGSSHFQNSNPTNSVCLGDVCIFICGN